MTTYTIKNKTYTLRRARQDDLAQITAIYNQGTGVANSNFEPVSVDSRQAWFDSHGDTRPIMVVVDEHTIAGWVSLSNLYDRPAYLHSTEVSIYIDKAYHGMGLGALLLDDMLGRAKMLGIANVVALVFGHNTSSLALFGKFGFERWGVLPKICLSQGMMADVVILGKNIGLPKNMCKDND